MQTLPRVMSGAVVALATSGLVASGAYAVPEQINTQGVLWDAAGLPIDAASADVTFRIWGASAGGSALWSETQALALVDGVFNALLPASATAGFPPQVDAAIADGAPLWLSIQLAGQAELPRVPLVSVPYALHAGSAEHASQADVAHDLSCVGCVHASAIDGSTFTSTDLAYSPVEGGVIEATTVGGALAQLDVAVLALIGLTGTLDLQGLAISPASIETGDLVASSVLTDSLVVTGGSLTIGAVSYVWPLADGLAGQFLETDGHGNLSWGTPSVSGSPIAPSSVTTGSVSTTNLTVGGSTFPTSHGSPGQVLVANGDGTIGWGSAGGGAGAAFTLRVRAGDALPSCPGGWSSVGDHSVPIAQSQCSGGAIVNSERTCYRNQGCVAFVIRRPPEQNGIGQPLYPDACPGGWSDAGMTNYHTAAGPTSSCGSTHTVNERVCWRCP